MVRTRHAKATHADADHQGNKHNEPRAADENNHPSRSVDEIAGELYSLSAQEFIPRRDAFVREAKARGDRETARAVAGLRKPSTAAWLTNQLVRAQPDEIRSLLDLGAGLREAQATLEGDQLRELSRQRRQLVNGLVQQARQLAVRLGKPVGDDVGRELEQTFEAALSSAESAAELQAGRLTTALEPSSGFGAEPSHLRVVRERPPHGAPAAKESRRRDTENAAARARLAAASAAAKDAARELADRVAGHDSLTEKLASLGEQISSTRESIAELSAKLRELEQQQSQTKQQERLAKRSITEAERAARNADLELEAARAALADDAERS